MNLEKRLKSAAQELNQLASRTAPPVLGRTGRQVRPWLAFTAAFAVVLAVVGVPYVISSFSQGAPSDAGPLASADSSTTTECDVPETTSTVVSAVDDIHLIAFLNDENSDGVPPGAHEALVTEVQSWGEVGSVSYFDKEHAWIEFQQVFEGQEDLLDIDPAILPASIRIELTDLDSQRSVQLLLEGRKPVVRSVSTASANNNPMAIWFGESVPELAEGSTDIIGCSDPGESTTTTAAVDTTTPGSTCAAGEMGPPTTVANGDPSYDLTEPVAQKLSEIAEAAAACNATGLAALASDDITTTFGPGSGPEDIASWQPDDERFEIITALFNMSHGVTEMPDGSALYVWPAAFAYDTWDEIPAAAMDELLRIYTQEELDQISLLGSYGGWRIGITEAGDWIFFVAGD